MKILAVVLVSLVSTLRLFAHNDTEIDETIDWTLESSLIGNNISLSFRPMPPPEEDQRRLIKFKPGYRGNWQYWSDDLTTFMLRYQQGNQNGDNYQICGGDWVRNVNKVCRVGIKHIQGACLPAYDYGYRFGQPCVAIEINTILGWKPDPYVFDDKPEDIPEEIRSKVTEQAGRKLWITCDGENPADKENIGPVTYYPSDGGIDEFYFPFANTTSHLSPLVLVHFGNVKTGVLINIECKAWAKNIVHNRMERKGSVHLELLID